MKKQRPTSTTRPRERLNEAKRLTPPVGPTCVELLDAHGYGVADDGWRWAAVLYRRKDGRFTCSVSQEMWLPAKKYRVPGLVGFRKGQALFDYLRFDWSEHTGEHLDEDDWKAVTDKVSTLDAKLADEMRQAIDAEYNPPPPPPPSAADLHARRATWQTERITSPVAGAFAGIKGQLRREAARFYANRYLAEHGRLPIGLHRVEVTVGPARSGADITSRFGSSGGERLVVDITYPDALDVDVAPQSGS